MFCPSCKDEFRSGFTRCQNCDVDLVDDLASIDEQRPAPGPALGAEVAAPRAVPMAEYCAYFTLDEARKGREALKAEEILSDIVVRESAEAAQMNALGEEYWLRVEASKYRQASSILGYDSADADADSTRCEACGEEVGVDAVSCPKCGMRFEER